MTKISNDQNNKHMHFLPLGGSGEIGMNLNLYEFAGKWLMIDCGITFEHDLGIEVITPDPTFIVERKKDLVGLVVTHAHEDHVGAIPYLYQKFKCPIYATPFTMGMVKRKLKDVGLLDQAELHEISLTGKFSIEPFDLEYVTLTHSIPEPNGLAVTTEAGTVFHTGDWKIDPTPLIGDETDVKRLKEIGKEGVLALVCDSTNALVAGRAGSEKQVREAMDNLVQEQTGRVVVACFASNIVRVETAALAAQKNGRKVALVGRSLFRMVEIAKDVGYLRDLPPFISLDEAMSLPKERVMMICTGSQGESRAALTRIAMGSHPGARLSAGDTVIFSSRMIPGNEESIHRVHMELEGRDIDVITTEDTFIHVSGHPSREDLTDMHNWVTPDALIPVHGEYRHMRAHAKLGEANGIKHSYVPSNGHLVRLEKGKAPKLVEEVHSGYMALDGQDLVPLTSTHLSEREMLKNTGSLFITLIVGAKAKLVAPPQVTLFGVVQGDRVNAVTEGVKQGIDEALETTRNRGHSDDNVKVREAVRHQVRQVVGSHVGKKPMIGVHVVRIKGKK
ncbi:ribonuclease J [Alphaproteobacteria bacterium]|nr:ribonuclease J [Alphaproteobacteria bacterium]